MLDKINSWLFFKNQGCKVSNGLLCSDLAPNRVPVFETKGVAASVGFHPVLPGYRGFAPAAGLGWGTALRVAAGLGWVGVGLSRFASVGVVLGVAWCGVWCVVWSVGCGGCAAGLGWVCAGGGVGVGDGASGGGGPASDEIDASRRVLEPGSERRFPHDKQPLESANARHLATFFSRRFSRKAMS